MEIYVDHIGNLAVVECQGRIFRNDSAFHLRDAVMSQADSTGIILDLSQVYTMDDGILYMLVRLQRWAAEHPNFRFVPVLSHPLPEDHWHGRTGLVHEAILEDYPDLSGHQLYACGSVKMVEAAHPAFAAHGLTQDDCFSDAFKLAPHRARATPAADMVTLGGS